MDFFGLSKPKPVIVPKKPSVPILQEENFAASIIGLEMEIEIERFTIEDIQTLIKLYSRAVEYYVAAQSNYCIYFQNKIKQLLLRPSVMAMIEGKEQKMVEKSNSIKSHTLPANSQSKILADELRETQPSDIALKKQGIKLTKELIVAQQDKDLNRLLKNFRVAEEVKNETFNRALHDQMANLGKKVQRRRNSLSRIRSVNLSKDQNIFDSKTADISNIDKLSGDPYKIKKETKNVLKDKDIICGLFLQGDDSLEREKSLEKCRETEHTQ